MECQQAKTVSSAFNFFTRWLIKRYFRQRVGFFSLNGSCRLQGTMLKSYEQQKSPKGVIKRYEDDFEVLYFIEIRA